MKKNKKNTLNLEKIPTEYVDKLLSTLAQYPQYHKLVVDLMGIISSGKNE